ncbi:MULTISPECIES: alpha-galactosidase [unclassified Streptomyces]|uniref:alpha-galactosidase n=1 Tax=unclassified Streptomyces TaxID=2593676 RepID=UPI00224EDE30|nr:MULTISPECIES: alpha-galactosidase [unclassified Streptomyces]MCX5053654.1 alpha-galactosidase [Streptomyces sp. NBC_00474]
MTYQRWTLRTGHTSYTVRLSPDGPWAELDAWGPPGVEHGPSALDRSRRTHFITPADAAPAEYLPYGLRPFTGAELVAARPGEERGVWWEFDGAEEDEGTLRLAFADDVLGLRTVLCYETVPGTDVILRWTEHTGTEELRLERFDSGRPGAGPADRLDLDAGHVAGYLRVLDHLRTAHPDVTVEGCAGGGGRTDHATLARTDVVWPSDNTAPLDRLRVQYGFLHAHAPHVMSSWVSDAPGVFDPRPRSLAFRFVNAMCGVLGVGADLRAWTPQQRAEAARWIARYKEVRDVVHHGEARLLGTPEDSTCGVQYDAGERTVVAALGTGRLDGAPLMPGRPDRLRLRGLDPAARYRDTATGTPYSGAHLLHYGLPFTWSAEYDADLVVLTRE